MTALLNYDNLFLDSGVTFTASNEATGFDKENAVDWVPATFWKPGATGTQYLRGQFASNTPVKYFAVASHNLGTEGCTVTFQYSSNGSTWNNFASAISPSDDTPIMRYDATGQNTLYYQIEITNCTVDTIIGVAAFGVGLTLPSPIPPGSWAPAPYSTRYDVKTNVTDGGILIGRSLSRRGLDSRIDQDLVPVSWIDSNWYDLIEHLAAKPAFFCWDYENQITTDSALIWCKDEIPKPDRYQHNFYRFMIPVNGMYY